MRTGRLSRRRFLSSGVALTGAAGLGARVLAAAGPGAVCVLTPEQEVGPFYVDGMLMRRNIREDRQGIPLRLRLVVEDSRTCAPLKGAAIDLWHCDALGLYSGFTKVGMGPGGPGGGPPPRGEDGAAPPPPRGERPGGVEGRDEGGRGGPPMGPGGGPGKGGPPDMKPSDKLTFLRGVQLTGPAGEVEFETIFPGFYSGRTNHIHFKVRLAGERRGDRYDAGHTSHIGQVFFAEDWNAKLMAQGPYAEHKIHRTKDAEDGIYNGQHGSGSVATLVLADPQHPERGLIAMLRVSVDPTATPKPVGMGGPGGPGGGPAPRPTNETPE